MIVACGREASKSSSTRESSEMSASILHLQKGLGVTGGGGGGIKRMGFET